MVHKLNYEPDPSYVVSLDRKDKHGCAALSREDCMKSEYCQSRKGKCISKSEIVSLTTGAEINIPKGTTTRIRILHIFSSTYTTLKPILSRDVQQPTKVYITFPSYDHDILMDRGDHRTVYCSHVDKYLVSIKLPDVQKPILLVQGILEIFNFFKDEIMSSLRTLHLEENISEVYVNGFSLGGSLARLLAFELYLAADFRMINVRLCAMGELQTGDKEWKNWWNVHSLMKADDTLSRLVDRSFILAGKDHIEDPMCTMIPKLSVVPNIVIGSDRSIYRRSIHAMRDDTMFDNAGFILRELEEHAFSFVSLYRSMINHVLRDRKSTVLGTFDAKLIDVKNTTHSLSIYRDMLDNISLSG
jgi:hypothetical protein